MINILIVEDEEMIRNGLRYTVDWLSLNAVVIDCCENGKEGLEKIMLYNPDIVITDIKMPIMDGLTMIEKAQNKGAKFLSILLSSYSEFEYAQKSIRLKSFEYLLKPISDKKLVEVIGRAKEYIEKEKQLQVAQDYFQEKAVGDNALLVCTSNNPHIAYTLQKIEKDYKEKLSVEIISRELGISSSYLSRVFKQDTSYTFLDFLNRYRINKSVELLSTKNYKVYEVAELVGFSDYKRFYSVFKEYTNISPTDFVKNGYCVVKK